MTFREVLFKIHSDNDQNISWIRAGCTLLLLTGTWSIIAQVTVALFICMIKGNMSQMANVEWMQPIALITAALAGKVSQKQVEKPS